MNKFSILLIENDLAVTAEIVSAIGPHLNKFTLTISRSITEALKEPGPADIILVNVQYLADDVTGVLTSLKTNYPHAFITLLVARSTKPDIIATALDEGADDYVALSAIGLLALTRRLVIHHRSWQEQTKQPTLNFSDLLCRVIAKDTSDMAIQLISRDQRVKAWNKTAETYFGLTAEQVVGRLIDDLPLAPDNTGRIKDILDHLQAMGQPFFIPVFPLEGEDSRWVHVHVYPVYPTLLTDTQETYTDICIVSTQVPDLTGLESENVYINQELQTLLEANREISSQLELDATLNQTIEQTKVFLNGENCQIYFLEKDNQTLRPVRALGPLTKTILSTPLTLGGGALGQIAATGKAAIYNSIDAKSEIAYPKDTHLLCAPLTALKGTMGLMVVSRRKSPFTRDDLRFFESLVQQASSAINNARLFEETSRSLNELAILYEASIAISTHWDDQDVLNTLIRKMVQAIDVAKGFIACWNDGDNKAIIEAEYANREANLQNDHMRLGTIIDLKQRPVLQNMISQQRPVFLHLSNPALDSAERQEMEQVGCRSRLMMPLLSKGKTIGWIDLWETRREHTFTADEVRMSRALASQIAVALQNTQYLQQTQQTLEETTALYRVTSALGTLQDAQAIMSTVLEEYLHALNLKQGSVIIFDYATKVGVVKARLQDDQPLSGPNDDYRILEGRQIPLQNNPVYERLMRLGQPVVIEDTKAKWLVTRGKAAQQGHIPPAGGWADSHALAILIIPIRIRGEAIGVLVVENTRFDRPFFGQAAISLGQAMADQLGVGLQNVELYESEFRRREQAETLREVASIVSSSLNLNEVLERILDQLARVIKFDSAAIQLITGNYRRIIAGRGFPNPEEVIGKSFIMSDTHEPGVIAVNARQPLVYGNITDIYSHFKDPVPQHIKSWMGVPLIARDKVIGLISIDNGQVNAYNDEDVELAVAFANQAAIALENARLYEIEVRELERELDIAHQIQSTLLPQTIPQLPGLDIVGRIIPARQVGGDFFHFFSHGPDQLGVAIGDVSGKGIPAALYMAAGITAIDVQIEEDLMPGELLNNLNKMLYNRLRENKMNIALQIATFIPLPSQNNNEQEARGSIMTVASAGMIAPIGATEHGVRFLPVSGLPIGVLPPPQQVYMDDVFLLDPFTTIIFTSDGIVEAQNESGELFGFDRLEKTILEIVKERNAKVIADHIIETTKNFVGQAEQHDDMTVVVVVKT
jgi:PAS domain S-box-containing protein